MSSCDGGELASASVLLSAGPGASRPDRCADTPAPARLVEVVGVDRRRERFGGPRVVIAVEERKCPLEQTTRRLVVVGFGGRCGRRLADDGPHLTNAGGVGALVW